MRAAAMDAAALRAKLAVRRYFLNRYYPDARIGRELHDGVAQPKPNVFDACAAGGEVWGQLRREYRVRYWGVDLKPQTKGTLKIDSTRILAQPSLPFNIVDVDTFGSPWRHWLEMLPNIRKPTTVFLTLGDVGNVGVDAVHLDTLAWLGLDKIMARVPVALRWKVAAYSVDAMLSAPYAYNLKPVDVMEAARSRTARYLGVRLVPV